MIILINWFEKARLAQQLKDIHYDYELHLFTRLVSVVRFLINEIFQILNYHKIFVSSIKCSLEWVKMC